MHPDKITPQVIELKYDRIKMMLTDDGKSETLIGLADEQAFVSHNMGVSWRKIDNISGSRLDIQPYYNEMHIIDQSISGHGYFLDSQGNVFQEVSLSSDLEIDYLESFSRHPQNPNALSVCGIGSTWSTGFDRDQRKWYYYTKDGGIEWKEMESNKEWHLDFAGPDYEFVDGGAPDLIYKYEANDYTEYALNFFSDSPLEFKRLPSEVLKLPYKNSMNQIIFFQQRDLKELYVSKDGISFEHIELPAPYQNSTRCIIHGGIFIFGHGFHQFTDERFRGSILIKKLYPKDGMEGSDFDDDSWLPWTTLFRYDVDNSKIKLLLEHCYDLTVISAEEGIVIANIVTNPQDCQNNNEEPKIRTVITFDDGTNWEPMKGPSGTEISVANSILHNCISSVDNDEKPSVPGLLIVYGKEGPIKHYMGKPRRDSDLSSFSTYMTKDSGRSWRKIHDDIMDWIIGGSGEIIILHKTPLEDGILYSLDGGMRWHQFNLGLPKLQFSIPPYRCESKRFLLENVSWNHNRLLCNYYCLSFDPADQKK